MTQCAVSIWGFIKYMTLFINQLADKVKVKLLLNGLAPDSDEPKSDETQSMVLSVWHTIEPPYADLHARCVWTEGDKPFTILYLAALLMICSCQCKN